MDAFEKTKWKKFIKIFAPNGEKLFVTIMISGIFFLTLTGFNARFIPCNSDYSYCGFNQLISGESYNINSYLSIIFIFSILPYFIATLFVEVFKEKYF